ncbi:MAG TPA: o-succinylbenzoate synthase, partial [Coriobacteriia bacterium]|nr:o-succinylbenzoate synthase [Coriobacteriia bacterium]
LCLLNHRLPEVRKRELLAGMPVRLAIDREWFDGDAAGPPAAVAPQRGASPAFVTMFTSGTTGRPKLAALSDRSLIGAAQAANARLSDPGEGVWQLTLPMFHVGGLEVVIRALANGSSFILYDRYDPEALLRDVTALGATHVSVIDAMLRDLLSVDGVRLSGYRAIVLGGGAPSLSLLEAVRHMRVHVTYGMTETCSMIATATTSEYLERGMRPLDGYDVRILDPDARGVGQIAVTGPGVFDGYLTAEEGTLRLDTGALAENGFRTGDCGSLESGYLRVEERISDMFVSGGENVYPREIELAVEEIEGVREIAVIGVEDERWGRRPVAFVAGEGLSAERVDTSLRARLAAFQRPDRVFVMDRLPRAGVGKLDRRAMRCLYEDRIEIVAVNLYRVRRSLKSPFRTSHGVMTERESVIVEVVDHLGRVGYGEGVAFTTPWYTDETVNSTMRMLTGHLAPTVLSRAYLDPAEVFPSLAGVEGHLMAKGAIEPACWDLYGRITGKSFAELIGGGERPALAGVSLGIMPVPDTVAAVRAYVAKGYTRVKLKIAAGDDVERVSAVRAAFPDIMLMVDANRGYTASDIGVFRALDGLGLVCIEEPIAHSGIGELAALQDAISTPVCVDESIVTADDLEEVLASGNLRVINLKIGKTGGVLPSLDLYHRCRESGIDVWLGGMYESGVSKYLHAFFGTLGGFDIPGDISETQRYFAEDIVVPELRVEDGAVVLPEGDGLGFVVDRERLERLTVEKVEVRA